MSTDQNQKNYNLWSESYDGYSNSTVAIDELSVPRYYSSWLGETVLEIGCGTGRHTVRLVEQGNVVTGLDLSQGMLKKAKEKLPSTQFIHTDFFEFDFAEKKFAKIFLSLVIEHFQDLEEFFKKVQSLLKDGGEVLFSEIHPIRAKKGSLAHFKVGEQEKEIWLESRPHGENEILEKAVAAGLTLELKKDVLGNSVLAQMNERWARHLDQPMIQIWSFSKR